MFSSFHPPGKGSWAAMLQYSAGLHARSTHEAQPPLPYAWEEIGPGYCYGPAFGHWDIVHQIMDVLEDEPGHARAQLLNNLENMTADGFLPGSIWFREEADLGYQWNENVTHPPVWPVAVDALMEQQQDLEVLQMCYEKLLRQIGWFEQHRKAEGVGYFYTDISEKSWESGVDEGIRFDHVPSGNWACVDATCHVYLLYERALSWATTLKLDAAVCNKKAEELSSFVRDTLWCEQSGFFHDIWAIRDPQYRYAAQEGMWPLVVGLASNEQAQRVIDEHLLNPEQFFTAHPLSTVGKSDPRFEQRMWRGPAWNSMTWWAARGCLRYQRPDAASKLLEAAMDATAIQFDRTGCIWEYYHSELGEQDQVARKVHTPYNTPCRDYLGHNPLIAMAYLWEQIRDS